MKIRMLLLALPCLLISITGAAQIIKPAHPPGTVITSPDKDYNGSDEAKEHEGEGALNYWKKLETEITEMNLKNGITNVNRPYLRYKAWKDAFQPNAVDVVTVNGTWSQISQSASTIGMGRIESVAFHPTDPNTFYIGTAGGGLWKTTNSGVGWQALTDGLATGGIADVVVDYSSPNTIYIATGAGLGGQSASSIGVLKSFDGGFSFRETGLKDTIGGTDPLAIYELKMHPTNPSILFAATNRGLLRTNNAGTTWSVVLKPVIAGPAIFDVEFKPDNPSVVYASYYYYVYSSSSNGDTATWNNSSLFNSYPTISSSFVAAKIAVSAADPSKVFIASAINSGNDSVRAVDGDVFLITATYNTLSNFVSVTTPKKVKACSSACIRSGGGRAYGDIYVSQTNASNIMIGGLETYSSATGGVSWVTKSFNCNTSGRNFHVDIGSINFNNGQLYVCTDGGIYRQTNEDYASTATLWGDITAGIEITQSYAHDGSPQDANYYLYANQDNNVHLRTSAASYVSVVGGDGTACKFDKTDKLIYYGCIQAGEFLYRFDHGVNTYITPGAGSGDGDTAQYSGTFDYSRVFMLDENINTTLYTAKRNFYRSINKGTNWIIKDVPGATSPHYIMKVAKSNSNTIYMVQEGGTFRRSTNGGDTWKILTDSLPSNLILSNMAVDPTASTWLYITCYGNVPGKKVYLSKNGGATFSTNLSAGLPNVDIRCIAVVGGVTNEVYVGTDVGIYYRNDNIGHWINFSNGLPVTMVMNLYINPTLQTISAATFGRGIWVSPLYGSAACPVNIALNNTYYNRYVFSASGDITSIGTIAGDANTNIKFSGGTNVIMSPGFVAEQNSNFKAVIEGCAPSPEPLQRDTIAITSENEKAVGKTKTGVNTSMKNPIISKGGKLLLPVETKIIIGKKEDADFDIKRNDN